MKVHVTLEELYELISKARIRFAFGIAIGPNYDTEPVVSEVSLFYWHTDVFGEDHVKAFIRLDTSFGFEKM